MDTPTNINSGQTCGISSCINTKGAVGYFVQELDELFSSPANAHTRKGNAILTKINIDGVSLLTRRDCLEFFCIVLFILLLIITGSCRNY